MNCPKCDNPLKRGTFRHRRSILSFLAFGIGANHLTFTESNGKTVNKILSSMSTAGGWRCPNCEISIIEEQSWC